MSTSGISAYNQLLISGSPSESAPTAPAGGGAEGAEGLDPAAPPKDNPFLGNTEWDCGHLLDLLNGKGGAAPAAPASGGQSGSGSAAATMTAMFGF